MVHEGVTAAAAARFPRRVLMTADTIGGVYTFALELARALAAGGTEVGLALLGGPPDEAQRRAAASVPGLRVFASSFRLEWMAHPWKDLALAEPWLLSLRDRLDPDVVHLNHLAHGAIAWERPLVVTVHSCVLSWWEAVNRAPAPATWNPYRDVVTRSLRAAGVVTAPTASMLAAAERHYGPLPRTRVVPNGREPRGFYTSAKDGIVLAAGRVWDPAKNIAALERVAPRLDWPVVVAGETAHPDGGTAAELRNARPLGRLDARALAGWYARAGIFAAPAFYEPFGLGALEAAHSGCALVLGDIPSLRETWDGAARFVPPGDDDALARALTDLIRDEGTRALAAAAARRRARSFLPEQMARHYAAAYAQAARADHGRERACSHA